MANMKSTDLKNFMIVVTGLDEMFLVIKGEKYKSNEWIIIRDLDDTEQDLCNVEEEGMRMFESDDFDNDLVCKDSKPASIVEVYDSLPIKVPFNVDVKRLFNEHKPRLLWKREPSPLSKSKMCACKTEEDLKDYIDTIVPPYIIVK